jgi:hypothetical protein
MSTAVAASFCEPCSQDSNVHDVSGQLYVDKSDATWHALFSSANATNDMSDTECTTATISIHYVFTLSALDRVLQSSWFPWIYALAQSTLAVTFVHPIPALGPIMWVLGLLSILIHVARLERTLTSLCIWRFDTLMWVGVMALYMFAVFRQGWSDDFWAAQFNTTPTRVRSFAVGRTVYTVYSFVLILAQDALAEWSMFQKIVVRVMLLHAPCHIFPAIIFSSMCPTYIAQVWLNFFVPNASIVVRLWRGQFSDQPPPSLPVCMRDSMLSCTDTISVQCWMLTLLLAYSLYLCGSMALYRNVRFVRLTCAVSWRHFGALYAINPDVAAAVTPSDLIVSDLSINSASSSAHRALVFGDHGRPAETSPVTTTAPPGCQRYMIVALRTHLELGTQVTRCESLCFASFQTLFNHPRFHVALRMAVQGLMIANFLGQSLQTGWTLGASACGFVVALMVLLHFCDRRLVWLLLTKSTETRVLLVMSVLHSAMSIWFLAKVWMSVSSCLRIVPIVICVQMIWFRLL